MAPQAAKIRTVFISNCENGWHVLNEILQDHPCFEVVAIVTTPEPEMQGMVSGYKSFDSFAAKFNIPLYKIKTLKKQESIRLLKSFSPEIMFCIGWSRLLTKEVLAIPPRGVIGMHPTLLPEGRGRAPIPWAIIKGLDRSGVTMFYIDEGVDTGDIIAQKVFDIDFNDDAATVYKKSVVTMVALARENLQKIAKGKAERKKQDETKATYWDKRTPDDGLIDWSKTAIKNYNFIRALTKPYPGAFSYINGKKVVVWKSKIAETEDRNKPGIILVKNDIIKKTFIVSCLKGSLEIQSFEGIEFDEIIQGSHMGRGYNDNKI